MTRNVMLRIIFGSLLFHFIQASYFFISDVVSEERDSVRMRVCINTSETTTITMYHDPKYTIASTDFSKHLWNPASFPTYKFVVQNKCGILTMDTATKKDQPTYADFGDFTFGINKLFCTDGLFQISVCQNGIDKKRLDFYHNKEYVIASTDFGSASPPMVNPKFPGYSLLVNGACAELGIRNKPKSRTLFLQFGNTVVEMDVQTCTSLSTNGPAAHSGSDGLVVRGNTYSVMLAMFVIRFYVLGLR